MLCDFSLLFVCFMDNHVLGLQHVYHVALTIQAVIASVSIAPPETKLALNDKMYALIHDFVQCSK